MGDAVSDRERTPEFLATLRRVRQIDPTCSDDAVRRYVLEIAEAEKVLAGLDVRNAVPEVSFSPRWETELER